MLNSLNKRRNFSREPSSDIKQSSSRYSPPSTSLISSMQPALLKEKPFKQIQSQDSRKKTQGLKFAHYSMIEGKYGGLSKKIKSLLEVDQQKQNPPRQRQRQKDREKEKENHSAIFNISSTQNPHPHIPKTNSTILKYSPKEPPKHTMYRRSQLLVRQKSQERPQMSSVPYFIQNLRRKSSISTQVYLHIHTSIHTFKQYLRAAQLAKPKPVDPSIPPPTQNRKTIVFDMDETLIHTSEVMTAGYEIKVPFRSFQGKVISGYVNVRPHAKEIIRNLSKHFDIIVFTAGNQCYADPILDHLDPNSNIQHRLYRESCTFLCNQLFLKDLRLLGRPLSQVILVDNAPHSYLMQLSNGVPILNYIKGKDDDQLIVLQQYLMNLIEVEDVRAINHETFRLSDYIKYDSHDKAIQGLYGKWVS